MYARTLALALLVASTCSYGLAQEKPKVDWEAEYQKLLKASPEVREKVESGQATKQEVIRWLQNTRAKGKNAAKTPPADQATAFRKKLAELVTSGKLTKEEAAKLAATMQLNKPTTKPTQKTDNVDWDAAYEKLLADPAARKKIEQSGATKAQVIDFLKKSAAAKNKPGNAKGAKGKKNRKGSAREGSFQFYALVIGRLRSKDIELGELEIDIDYVISDRAQVNQTLVGSRVKLVGVSGKFRDDLLKIKRGETIKVRTGDFNPDTKVLGFGYKFHVLERTDPFTPGDFGVPPKAFRGFHGELTGKVVEAAGYEVLLQVKSSEPTDDSQAADPNSIIGKRIRIAGFFNENREAFEDLQAGDHIRLTVAHRNSTSDAMQVTNKVTKVDN